MEKFDFLKLHDFSLDKKPKSWICVNGGYLYLELKKLLFDLNKFYSKRKVASTLSQKSGLNFSGCKRFVYGKKRWFPILLILELLRLWKNKLDVCSSEYSQRRLKINEKIKFFKVNNSLSKPIQIINSLSIDLAKICGAHAADGWMCCKFRPKLGYRCEYTIREGQKYSLQQFQHWVKNCFNLNTQIKKDKTNNFSIAINNKVLIRFLHVFFNFPYGKKTDIVNEPEIIKKSLIKYRKAFALGVLTFDGYVGKRVELMVRSKYLRDSVWEIVQTDNLKGRSLNYADKFGRWRFYSSEVFDNQSISKWLGYFETGTYKYTKLLNKLKC